jgi:hypothetical protein
MLAVPLAAAENFRQSPVLEQRRHFELCFHELMQALVEAMPRQADGELKAL